MYKPTHIARVLSGSALVLYSIAATAFSECSGVNVTGMWTGSGGEILLEFDNAPPVYVYGPSSATDSAQKNTIAVVLTSIATNRLVQIRYVTDGVSCTTGPARSDFAGIWIFR
jgi:hypothetical protein